jgi:hypothetical protein
MVDMSRTAFLLLIAAAVACATAGLLLDPLPFIGNLLGESFGIAISVVVAVTLVERILQLQRVKSWNRVRSQVSKSIFSHLRDIAFAYYNALNPHIEEEIPGLMSNFITAGEPNASSALSIAKIGEYISARTSEISELMYPAIERHGWHKFFLDRASSRSLYAETAPHVQSLRDSIVPHILQFGEDPILVELLFEIQAIERDWAGWLEAVDEWGAPEEKAWEEAAKLIRAAGKVVEHLASHQKSA